MVTQGLLADLAAALAQAGAASGGLSAERVELSSPQWFERRVRVYADPAHGRPGVGPYVERRQVFGELRARLTSETVALSFTEGIDRLHWARGSKRQGTELVIWGCADPATSVHAWQPGNGAYSPSLWTGPPTRPTTRPPHWDRLLPCGPDGVHEAWTGTVVSVLRARLPEPQTVALLFFAKRDTRFRRLGLWGLRPDLLAALPPEFAHLLHRGRSGALQAPGSGRSDTSS